MDCKHEKERVWADVWDIECVNCGEMTDPHQERDLQEYYIVHKAQYALRQVAVVAAREYHKGGHHKDNCRPQLPHLCKCGRYWLEKALDALDKEDNERGL